MARRSEIADQLIEAIGMAAAQVLIRAFGGKQITVPDGSGRAGAFSAWLDDALGPVAAAALRHAFGGERLTVPKDYATAISARNRIIVADYDGGLPMIEMIRKHDLTERQLRTILKQPVDDAAASRPVDDRQPGLF